MSQAEQVIARGRAYLKRVAPYLSSTVYGLVPHAVENLRHIAGGPIAVTERMVLLYDPAWVSTLTDKVIGFALFHEVMHVQLKHVARGKLYEDPKRFNIAGDLFINGISARDYAAEFEMPEWVALPNKYGFETGLTADEYYRLLESKGKGGKGDEEGQGTSFHGKCGSCAGHGDSNTETGPDGEIGRSEEDVRAIARATEEAIKDSVQKGTLPGVFGELVGASDDIQKIPWRTELANVLRFTLGEVSKGSMDYSMRRPSKRSYLRGIMLPGLISYEPRGMIAMDSSGSMSAKELGYGLGVCIDLLLQTGITQIWYVDVDAEVQAPPAKVSVSSLRNRDIKGRGGTSFRPVFSLIENMRTQDRPNFLVYITDGYGDAPATQPSGLSTIWAVVPGGSHIAPASWGRTIFMKD